MESIETLKVGNLVIDIKYDDYPDNPRSWDNLGTMVCFHGRYNLGDKHYFDKNDYNSWEELGQAIIESENVHTMLPIYMYDHSGITISTGPFSCKWDSGQIGFIYISKDKVQKEGLDDSKVEDYLRQEVETYDSYLRGEVFEYSIRKVSTCDLGHEHSEIVDACAGYYDLAECKAEAMNYAETYRVHEVIADYILKRETKLVNK